ncbi:MAG TPA: hypothetical protein VFN09_11525 [Rhodanobacteraceae bacterium]|nr:hypothetical protein [Rhodanobacteraceae bacterium]
MAALQGSPHRQVFRTRAVASSHNEDGGVMGATGIAASLWEKASHRRLGASYDALAGTRFSRVMQVVLRGVAIDTTRGPVAGDPDLRFARCADDLEGRREKFWRD